MLATKEKFKSNMKINKTFDSNGFTQVSNNIVNDSRLDLKEKGLMLHILSKPDGWFLNVDEICKNNRDGKKAVYSGIKKLKELGYIKLKSIQDEKGKIIRWEYTINLTPTFLIVDPFTQKGQVEKGQVENRSYNNTNINNKNNYYYKNNNNTFEDEENNVENCVIQISNIKKEKEDLEKIQIIKDYLVNITSPDLPFKLKDVESLQRQVKEFYYGGMPIDDIKTMIDLFPDFVKANKNNNPKKSFSEYQSLSLLADALKKNYNYPEWFLSLHKKEQVKKEVNNLEVSWKQITEFWDARGSRIDDCIKNMIKMILESIQDFEYHKVNNLSNDKRMIEFFNTATKKTLSKKSISEVMDLIKEYISKTWLSVDPFQKQINSFNDAGFTLDTIKSYFLSGVN